jgi:hypothetical protein
VSFYNQLIDRLKKGSIKNIKLFGNDMGNKPTPYLTIKPIAGGDRELLQFIVHMGLGTHELLKNYLLMELATLLKEPIEYDGKSITVRSTGVWTGPYVDEGDNSLAMSRDFYIPIII